MTATFECFKCSGSGRIVAFSGIANGVCFQCGGTGKLTSSKAGVRNTSTRTEVPEAIRSTDKQWAFIAKLGADNSDTIRRWIYAAGADCASQVYVSKAVMSRAIDIAKGKGA
jgi:hypothetical protein